MNSLSVSPAVSRTDVQLAVRQEKARRSLLAFAQYVSPEYKPAFFHRIIASRLDAAFRGDVKRLMMGAPPQHGKSQLSTRFFPAYILGRNPNAHIIIVSYGQDLASRMSLDIQRVMQTDAYMELFKTRLPSKGSGKKLTEALFEVEGGKGSLRAVGVGGALTGMGANYIILDDVVKDRAEAESETIREHTWGWYTDTLYTRQRPNCTIVELMTRWHLDDLIGRQILKEGEPDSDQWEKLFFPAIADGELHPEDPRQKGEPLWAERYGLDFLRLKKAQGSYGWNALYQQRPISSEGGLFKREHLSGAHVIDEPPADIVQVARGWDLAMSSKTTADYTAGVKMGRTSTGDIIVLDVDRSQREWGEVEPYIASAIVDDGTPVQQSIEAAFYQSRAVKELLEREELHNYAIWGARVDKDKVTRALPFAARVEAGKVYLLRRAWTQAYVDELCSFPLGVNDDQVDGSSLAYERLGEPERTAEQHDYNPFYGGV